MKKKGDCPLFLCVFGFGESPSGAALDDVKRFLVEGDSVWTEDVRKN